VKKSRNEYHKEYNEFFVGFGTFAHLGSAYHDSGPETWGRFHRWQKEYPEGGVVEEEAFFFFRQEKRKYIRGVKSTRPRSGKGSSRHHGGEDHSVPKYPAYRTSTHRGSPRTVEHRGRLVKKPSFVGTIEGTGGPRDRPPRFPKS